MRALLVHAVMLGGCNWVYGLQSTQQQQLDASIDAPSRCPATYQAVDLGAGAVGYYRYGTSADLMSFGAADQSCVGDGAGLAGKYTHLAVLASPTSVTAEFNAVFLHIPDPTLFYAIGLTDLADLTTFQWVTDEPVMMPGDGMPPWLATEPARGNGNCVRIQAGQVAISTESCGAVESFICECDDYPVFPAHL